MSRRFVRTDGFTLVEVIVVLVLVAIMGVTAITSMSSLSDSRQAAAAGQVLHDLQFARERAVALGTTTWVVFDEGADQLALYIEDVDRPGRANRTIMPDPSGVGNYEITLNEGAFQDGGIVLARIASASEIGFNTLGQPLTSAEEILTSDAEIELEGGYLVIITGTTGHIHRGP